MEITHLATLDLPETDDEACDNDGPIGHDRKVPNPIVRWVGETPDAERRLKGAEIKNTR